MPGTNVLLSVEGATVALIRSGWRGFSGGTQVWSTLEEFFDRLAQRAQSKPAAAPVTS